MNKFIVFLFYLAVTVVNANEDEGEVLYNALDIKTFSMPESCKKDNKAFCFSDEGYPKEIVEELLKDITTLEVVDNTDNSDSTYGHRDGISPDEYDCQSDSTSELIYYIIDEDGNDRVVVQMEGRFIQRYSIMWCKKEGRLGTGTEHFLEKTVKDFKMSCENKYIDYDFLVLSKETDLKGNYQIERVKTKTGIPVCCACRYEKLNK